MKELLTNTLGYAVGIMAYVIFAFGVPMATIAGGIWLYNEIANDEPTSSVSTSSYRYSEADVKKDFIDDCVGEEATYAYCSCVYEGIRADYTIEQLRVNFGNATESEIMEFVFPYAMDCVQLVDWDNI